MSLHGERLKLRLYSSASYRGTDFLATRTTLKILREIMSMKRLFGNIVTAVKGGLSSVKQDFPAIK